MTEPSGPSGNFPSAINHILVPIDFSPKCHLALEHAVQAARIFGASITLLHVLDTTVFVAASLPGALSEIVSHREAALEEMAKSVTSYNIPCTILIRQGDLDGQVQEVISENQIDLLVLVTKAGTAMAGFALASTAERILRKTLIRVLTIAGTHPVRKWTGDGCLHLFYATDLSPNSLRSLEYARNLRHRFCVEFTIAHVLPKNASLDRIESVTHQLNALAEGTSTKVAVLQGPVGPSLCHASANAGADLIVVGVKNHSLLRELLLGHILLELLHGACCPVITIRQ